MKKLFTFLCSVVAVATAAIGALCLFARLAEKRLSFKEGISDYIDCSLHTNQH